MINLVNIQHIHKVLSNEFNNNMKEYEGTDNWEFKQLKLIMGNLILLEQRLEKNERKS